MQNAVIIIPSFCPDQKMIALINQLFSNNLTSILIVNDGSSKDYDCYFEQAQELGCTVLTHEINQGKGRALKTAFQYVIDHYPSNTLAVCADSDGQHIVDDIIACLALLEQNPDCLIMGCRTFKDKSIPFRSRFGNNLTKRVFKLLCGVAVSDTQTGLRALTIPLMKTFIHTKGDRFEYEMNMLIDTKQHEIPIKEVAIQTVYIEENITSHFNPLRDSFRIYSVFLKFIASSSLSFLIDISIFTLCIALFENHFNPTVRIVAATAIARLISSFINFTINRNSVFQATQNKKSMFIKYYILCVIQLICSAFAVDLLFSLLKISEVIVKLIVDTILFILSFQIQREWVFKKNKNTN